jgi:hypothetical protein
MQHRHRELLFVTEKSEMLRIAEMTRTMEAAESRKAPGNADLTGLVAGPMI